MPKVSGTWKRLSTDPLIATFEYSFGPGTATSLAVGIPGGVLVASPPCRVADPVIGAMDGFGGARALVATNAFHYMGLRAWKARYPEAAIFAPEQSIARVTAKTGLPGIRPLADAGALLGEHVSLTDMPFYKTGEALIRIRTAKGLAWYVTDVILNMPELPAHPLIGLLFRISRSAPGLRLNRISPLFMVKDRRALWRWLRAEAEKDRPRLLIPTHGEVVEFAATGPQLCDLLQGRRADTPGPPGEP